MKKIKLDTKRLHLKKEKIASLTQEDMNRIVGGDGDSSMSVNCPTRTCVSSCLNKCDDPPPGSVSPCTIDSLLVTFCFC